jgi:orotate phosphoribosyltransferase
LGRAPPVVSVAPRDDIEVVSDPHGVLNVFQACDAVQRGHFRMSGGLHSPFFFQKALVFQHPRQTEYLCGRLAELIVGNYGYPTCVVSAAVGGVIPGYETARHFQGCTALYLERAGLARQLSLRRGFTLGPGQPVVLVEDVMSTGGTTEEAARVLRGLGARVLGAAVILDRSDGLSQQLSLRVAALAKVRVPVYTETELPPELADMPVTEPGSRRLS